MRFQRLRPCGKVYHARLAAKPSLQAIYNQLSNYTARTICDFVSRLEN
jgi:hypothetical protein